MKNLKKKIKLLVGGTIVTSLIIGGCVVMGSGTGGPEDPPLNGSNTQITQTFHC